MTRHTQKPADPGAPSAGADPAFTRLYDELRLIAERHMRRQRPGHTLSPTALVHEAYVKIQSWADDRAEPHPNLPALASRAMRQLLIDHARRRARRGPGDNAVRVTLSDLPVQEDPSPVDALALDEALVELERLSARQAAIVEMRCFGDYTIEQCAEALGVARSTVAADWRLARAWLKRFLDRESGV
ncbi:MAG: sigma-70 family RNA polymerase sigma factor [Planctomycetota bacterium]|nr:MAG: sigma-70 family RNA polymerase sigma factor [Planctomycetota bacterium]